MLTKLVADGLGVGEAHLRSYKSIENVEVHSICDIDPNHLKLMGDRYDIEKRCLDHTQITEDPEIQVVSICSYDNCHADQIISALRHGKHIMVEKPAVLYPTEAENVLKELEGSGLFLTSSLILRQSPRFIEIRDMVQQGILGDIFHIEADYLHQILWKITEGWRGKMEFCYTVYSGGIHLIDLMR